MPLKTVFISGIPLPSASFDIKYPTDVANNINIILLIIQKKKLNILFDVFDINVLFAIPVDINLSKNNKNNVFIIEKKKIKIHSIGSVNTKYEAR